MTPFQLPLAHRQRHYRLLGQFFCLHLTFFFYFEMCLTDFVVGPHPPREPRAPGVGRSDST
jgi:hypothetical protein